MSLMSRSGLAGGGGVPASIVTRIETLENNEIKVAYFAEISSGTSGTVSIPTGATVLLDQLPGAIDAILSAMSGASGQPTGASPLTAGGTVVSVSSFDTSGNYTLSGTPASYPVALIYLLKIDAKDWSNLTTAKILEYEKGPFGSTAGTYTEGNDSRLSDVRNQKIIAYQNISASHTGNTNETIVEGNLIVPANAINANGRLMIDAQYGATGTASTKTFRIYINSSANTLVGATLVATTQLSSSNLSGGRRNIIQNKNSQSLNEVIAPTASLTADTALTNAAAVTLDYNFATISYFIVTVQNGSAADTGILRNIQILASNP